MNCLFGFIQNETDTQKLKKRNKKKIRFFISFFENDTFFALKCVYTHTFVFFFSCL